MFILPLLCYLFALVRKEVPVVRSFFAKEEGQGLVGTLILVLIAIVVIGIPDPARWQGQPGVQHHQQRPDVGFRFSPNDRGPRHWRTLGLSYYNTSPPASPTRESFCFPDDAGATRPHHLK